MTGKMFTRDGAKADEADEPKGRVLVAHFEANSGTYKLEQVDGETKVWRYRGEDQDAGTATGDSARRDRDDTAATLKAINARNRQHHARPAKS